MLLCSCVHVPASRGCLGKKSVSLVETTKVLTTSSISIDHRSGRGTASGCAPVANPNVLKKTVHTEQTEVFFVVQFSNLQLRNCTTSEVAPRRQGKTFEHTECTNMYNMYNGKRQRQSQSPESVAPNVRARNPIGQSQSPVNTSTGCRETMNGRQKVSNKESVTPRKPGGGSRNPGETESQQQRVSHP